jgi:hypothetical protein
MSIPLPEQERLSSLPGKTDFITRPAERIFASVGAIDLTQIRRTRQMVQDQYRAPHVRWGVGLR